MKKMLIAIAIACLIPWNYAKADDGPFITELGALQPLKESQIRMESEDVVFTYAVDGTIKGRATFNFVNTADTAVKLDTIFPLEGNAGYEDAVQYAKNVTVKVDGKTVGTEMKKGSYPERAVDSDLVVSPLVAGIVFPLAFEPNGKRQVEVSFTPQTTWLMPTFNYLVGSGAGWAGSIGRADFSVVYPIALQSGWVTMRLFDASDMKNFPGEEQIKGNRVTFSVRNLEPGGSNRMVEVTVLPLSMAKEIVNAQKAAKISGNSEDYWSLAEVYKNILNHGFGPAEHVYDRPEFTKKGYWDAVAAALAIEGDYWGSQYWKDRVTGYYNLLKIYSNGWDAVCNGNLDCTGLTDPKKYTETYNKMFEEHSDSMFGRENGDEELITYIKDMDRAWRRVRPDLFPITSSTAELVSPQPAEEVAPAEPVPQLTYLDASSIMNDKALANANEKEYPPIFWVLVGFAGGLFSWSGWLWFTRRRP